MMPTFEPVAIRSIVLNRANKLAANSNFYIDGFEAHKMGNLVQAIFETIESHLQQAYEAGLRDAVPEGFTLAPNEPTEVMLSAAMSRYKHQSDSAAMHFMQMHRENFKHDYIAMLAEARSENAAISQNEEA